MRKGSESVYLLFEPGFLSSPQCPASFFGKHLRGILLQLQAASTGQRRRGLMGRAALLSLH